MRIGETPYGRGVFAERELSPGTIVGTFEGPRVPLDQVPETELRYVVRIGRDRYLVPRAPERLINHACEPNCEIADELRIVAPRPIRAGEQLTISYDRITATEALAWGSFWHQARSFSCHCGAPACVGRVERYRVVPRTPGRHE